MTPFQSFYLQFWTFAPPIFLAIRKAWWVGLLSFVAFGVISVVLNVTVSARIGMRALPIWAWIKPALVGGGVFALCWVLW